MSIYYHLLIKKQDHFYKIPAFTRITEQDKHQESFLVILTNLFPRRISNELDSSSDAFISYPQKDSCNFKPHFPSPCQGGLRG